MKITEPEGKALNGEEKEEVIAISTDDGDSGAEQDEPFGEGDGDDAGNDEAEGDFNSSGLRAVHSAEDEVERDESENEDEQAEGVEDDDAEQALNSSGEPAVELVEDDEAEGGDNDDAVDDEGEHVERSGPLLHIGGQVAEADGSDFEPGENGEVEDDEDEDEDEPTGSAKRQRLSKEEIGDDERPPK